MYKVFLTREAAKYYSKCDLTTKRRLDKCFKELEREPVYSANVKQLHGELTGFFRYRTGGLRIVYGIEDNRAVLIVAIGTRGDIYKKV
jgi:mRNA interferase RelE/StbE